MALTASGAKPGRRINTPAVTFAKWRVLRPSLDVLGTALSIWRCTTVGAIRGRHYGFHTLSMFSSFS